MKSEYIIIGICFIHWIADFLLQSEKMATNKSKDNFWLFAHVVVYSIVWLYVGVFFFDPTRVVLFVMATFVCHFTTDYFTSRWTSKLYTKKKYYGFPSFFGVIGFDQFLHIAQLILCYLYIIK